MAKRIWILIVLSGTSLPLHLENDFLSLDFKLSAAEFTSLFDKKSGLEFAWSGDPNVWAGRNPTLFPIVGKVWQEHYNLGKKQFSLGNHGFARHSEFSLIDCTATSLTLSLENSPATFAVYPFRFRLTNHYQLQDNSLLITLTVLNLDEQNLPFSIGAHPAFKCPLLVDEKFSDYQIVFERIENLSRLQMNPDSSFQVQRSSFGQNVKTIPLTHQLFSQDALVFENLASSWVRLQGPRHSVTVSNPGCPWFGLWSKGDFVCLEPWHGHGDFVHYNGDFTQREGMLALPPSAQFVFSYSITIN